MKVLKRIGMVVVTMLMAINLISCNEKYDDTAIWNDIEQIKQKITELENLCRKTNENIASLQIIVSAMENADYITDLTPITNDGVIIGYKIVFAKKGAIFIYNGKDGQVGKTPVVGIKKHIDGKYYWTVDGEFITADGKMVAAQAESAPAPQLKIENGYWYISYNGTDWTSVGKATSEETSEGKGCVFTSVTQDDDYVYFTLTDGNVIKLSKKEADKNDDKEDKEMKKTLVGKWIITNTETNTSTSGGEQKLEAGDWMEFKEDNTCSWSQSGAIMDGKYMLKDKVVTVYDINSRSFAPFSLQIEELTSTRLVLTINMGDFFQFRLIFEKKNESNTDRVVVTVPVAGTLKDALKNYDTAKILNLTVKGEMDARDFNFLKCHCKNLKDVDLSEVTIIKYTGTEGTNEGYTYTYVSNQIPLGAFFYWVPEDEGMPSLQRVVIPKSTKVIQRNAFARAYNLTDINFPEGLKTIDYVAFALCSSLEEIYLPSTLGEIGQQAFHNCSSLKKVHVASSSPAYLDYDAFGKIDENAVLYVPKGSLKKYQDSDWSYYFNIQEED